MSRHDQLPQHINLIYNKIVYMNIMAEAWQASAHLFPPSFIVWLLTLVMKHEYIGGTDFLDCQQADPAQGLIYSHRSHG